MVTSISTVLLGLLGLIIIIPLAIVVAVYVLVPMLKGIVWLFAQVFRFIFGELGDVLRILGAVVTGILFVPLVIGSIIIGRWSAAGHYGRAVQGEIATVGVCVYRLFIGHPARLLCLTALTDGIEHRLPEVMAATPGRDKPKRRIGQFDGYTIIGSLPGGGSGGRLYIAEPDEIKLAGFERVGQHDVDRVVIKVFSLRDGSSLPQIVRESRSLDAARKLGLVLEHELTDERFFYVMRYVPGEPLGLVTQRLHAGSESAGLGKRELREAVGYACDLVRTLSLYHSGGLWHKDVKPDNIIIHDGQAHLVDFGLITPLRSSMTLTTHGTEYFRDPEMVRMALKGVKVHEVNGAKFDIYAAGAVLFSVIENSFPAHGGLSQVTQRCPEALRWIIRRAMTDYDKRYASAQQMLADLRVVAEADDPFAVKPVALPSMRGATETPIEPEPVAAEEFELPAEAFAATPTPPPPPPFSTPERTERRGKPKIRVTGWWSGRFEVDEPRSRASVRRSPTPPTPGPAARPVRPTNPRPRPPRSASAQLQAARARAQAARDRAKQRIGQRRRRQGDPALNRGVLVAVVLFMLVFVGAIASMFVLPAGYRTMNTIRSVDSQPLLPPPLPTEQGVVAVQHDPPPTPPSSAALPVPPISDSPAVSIDVGGTRMAVLRDPIAFDPAISRGIDHELDRLESSGFDLIGYGQDDDTTAITDTELLAGLRRSLGLAPFKSEAAARTLRSWLGEHADVGLVLWVSRNPDKPDDATAWLVRGETCPPEVFKVAYDSVTDNQ